MYTREEIARVCRSFGGLLWLPAEIDGSKLLWAIAGCESSFGANCKPRHEQYYHELAETHHNAEIVALTEKYGCGAHSSFGPWQELLVNCKPGTAPEDMANLNRAALETVQFINHRILEHEQAKTVKDIAAAYNSGKWRWVSTPPGVIRYENDCQKYYDAAATEMPAAVV